MSIMQRQDEVPRPCDLRDRGLPLRLAEYAVASTVDPGPAFARPDAGGAP